MRRKLLDAKTAEGFLDEVAQFLVHHVPGYEQFPVSTLDHMETVWLAIATNRKDFMKALDKLKATRKKRVV